MTERPIPERNGVLMRDRAAPDGVTFPWPSVLADMGKLADSGGDVRWAQTALLSKLTVKVSACSNEKLIGWTLQFDDEYIWAYAGRVAAGRYATSVFRSHWESMAETTTFQLVSDEPGERAFFVMPEIWVRADPGIAARWLAERATSMDGNVVYGRRYDMVLGDGPIYLGLLTDTIGFALYYYEMFLMAAGVHSEQHEAAPQRQLAVSIKDRNEPDAAVLMRVEQDSICKVVLTQSGNVTWETEFKRTGRKSHGG